MTCRRRFATTWRTLTNARQLLGRGRERVLDEHTYAHRMKSLLQHGIGHN